MPLLLPPPWRRHLGIAASSRQRELARPIARWALFVEPDQSDLPCPAPFAKIFPFAITPNQIYILCRLIPRGAYRDRHGRGMGCGGRRRR